MVGQYGVNMHNKQDHTVSYSYLDIWYCIPTDPKLEDMSAEFCSNKTAPHTLAFFVLIGFWLKAWGKVGFVGNTSEPFALLLDQTGPPSSLSESLWISPSSDDNGWLWLDDALRYLTSIVPNRTQQYCVKSEIFKNINQTIHMIIIDK